jgi:hypothetical protein
LVLGVTRHGYRVSGRYAQRTVPGRIKLLP